MTFSVIAKPLYHFCRQKFEISFYNTLYTHLILTNFAKLKFNCSHIQPPYVFHAGDCHARKLARNDRFGFTCHCERTQWARQSYTGYTSLRANAVSAAISYGLHVIASERSERGNLIWTTRHCERMQWARQSHPLEKRQPHVFNFLAAPQN